MNKYQIKTVSNKLAKHFLGFILLFVQAHSVYSQPQNTLLEQAIEARNTGEVELSIALLNQELMTNPLNLRLKIELASSYFLLQEYDKAETLALEVLDSDAIPPTVRSNITMFVAKIKQKQNSQSAVKFTQYHTVNVFSGHDSNANVAPADSTIDIGTLTESSAQKSSPFLGLSYDFTQFKPIQASTKHTSQMYHYNGVTFYNKDYFDLNQSDLMYLGARAGIKYDFSNQWFSKAKVAFTYIDLNNQKFAHDYLLSSQLGYTKSQSEIALQLSGNYKNYFRNVDQPKKGHTLKQSLLYRYEFKNNADFHFSVSNQDANLKQDRYSYDSLDYSTSFSLPVNEEVKLTLGGSYTKNKHRDIQQHYSHKRHDTLKKYHLKLNVLNIFQGFDSQFSYQYAERDSNNQINVYNRNLLMATLTYQFGPY